MGTLIPQTKYDVLVPGTYRVKLGAVALEEGAYGTQVAMQFDLLDEGFAGRCVKAWAAVKLSGGRRPSKRDFANPGRISRDLRRRGPLVRVRICSGT